MCLSADSNSLWTEHERIDILLQDFFVSLTLPFWSSKECSGARPASSASSLDRAPAAAPASCAPSPQAFSPKLHENYRRYFESKVQLECVYLQILILYEQNMRESIFCCKTSSSPWPYLSGVRKNAAVLVMCLICLSVDFVTRTSKWIDTTWWWASALGIVFVHYTDGAYFLERKYSRNIISIIFIVLMALVCCANSRWLGWYFLVFVSKLFVDGFRLRNVLYGFCPLQHRRLHRVLLVSV